MQLLITSKKNNQDSSIHRFIDSRLVVGNKILIGKKIQDATGEKLSTFLYSKVYQWQYNKAMRFALWVDQKIYLSTGLGGLFNFQVHEAEEL